MWRVKLQVNSRPSSYRVYDPEAMTRAYLAVVEDNMPVKTAARKFSVPETTLRDRARGRIHPETLKSGTEPILSLEKESRLVEHLKFMSSVGYGYTRVEVTTLASQYAVQLGKRNKDNPFSLHWYYGFMKRWPSLKLDNPRPLEVFRAKATSQEAVSKYFVELRAVLEKYDLFDKPQFIYNVDEKGLIENHTPPKVVSSSEYRCVAVTTPRSSTTTLIGCGNALGQQIPPYFVFKGQCLRSDILSECTPGTNATTSDSGWSNMEIFSTYLNDHFLKYAQRSDPSQPILLLYDGHRSHVSLPIIDWAISRNIVLMVLPAHTSHVLQPLDVGCFGPLERIYNSIKHTYMREQVTTNIDRNAMCAVACKAYTSALSPRNLMSSFEKCGIFPFDDSVVSAEALRPSTVFITSEENREADDSLFRQKEDALHKIKSAPTLKRKVLSSIVSGKAITEENTVFKIQEHTQKQPVKKRKQQSAQKKKVSQVRSTLSAKPSTSGLSHVREDVASDSGTDTDTEGDDKVCCVCKLFQPKELQNCVSIVFTKWAQCTHPSCDHWVHLKYCTQVRVVRSTAEFWCPCHSENSEE